MMRYLISTVCSFLFIASLTGQSDHWETAINHNDSWRYVKGSNQVSTAWREIGFDDADWSIGQGSIGYGDNDDNTIITSTVSLFMRREFYVTDKSKLIESVLHADFDDGFVAYLNGVEIARKNISGQLPQYYKEADQLNEASFYQGGIPEGFSFDESLLNQILVNGVNVLCVQTHNFEGLASSDMTSNYWLSFGISDNSSFYGPTPPWFQTGDFLSNLPILQVNTNGQYIPNEPSIQGEVGIVWNGLGMLNHSQGDANEFLGNVRIERRGQSSLDLFPKNGFFFETQDELGEDLDTSFLNFPTEEDWILHGPYSDKTLMRNVLTMHLARSMGQYSSRTRFVELMINEEYQGIYVLMEKIKRDKNRVDIAKLKVDDISGDQLTGGYVFKVDKGDVDWFSNFGHLTDPNDKIKFQFVSPSRDVIVNEQREYIRKYVDSFERSLIFIDQGFAGKHYTEYCDRRSFADFFILNELVKDVDAYRLSTYLHKDKDSKGGRVTIGPMWDFNLSLGNSEFCNVVNPAGLIHDEQCGRIPTWWRSMLDDQEFEDLMTCRWNELREGPFHRDSIMDFIDSNVSLLTAEGAVERNFTKWPVLNEYVWPNAVVTGSYMGEINFMKDYIEQRLVWLDSYFGNCTNMVSTNDVLFSNVSLSPNPSNNILYLHSSEFQNRSLDIEIISSLGKVLKSVKNHGQATIELNVVELEAGVYFLRLSPNGTQQRKSMPFVKIL